MRKSFILAKSLKIEYFNFFLVVKMAEEYAKIGRVGILNAGFQQITVVKKFWNFQKYCDGTYMISNQWRKSKNNLYLQISKNPIH